MQLSPQKKVYQRDPLVKNKVGVNFVYLHSKVTSKGGGTYISRALAARNDTGADVIVFMIPSSENALETLERIKRCREDLASAVRPLILPFKIVAVISENQKHLENFFSDSTWNDVRY